MGDVVMVLDSDRYWRKVSTPDPYVGWTTEMSLAFKGKEEIEAYISAPKEICITEYAHVFSRSSESSDRICDMVMGDLVRYCSGTVLGDDGIRSWKEVILPDDRHGWVRSWEVMDFASWVGTQDCSAENLVSFAKRFLGVPYMWGGISPKHFDCSGFVKFTYMMLGVLLMRDSSQQIKTGVGVPFDFGLMQAGDLVFFGNPETGRPTHVALYIGDGRIIHSSQVVRINSLRPEDPDYYGAKEVIAVRRVLGHIDTGEGVMSWRKHPLYFKQ